MHSTKRKWSVVTLIAFFIVTAMILVSGFNFSTETGDVWKIVGWVAAGCWALASTSFSYYRTLDDCPVELKVEIRYGGTELLLAAIYFALSTGIFGLIQYYESTPLYERGKDPLWLGMSAAALGLSVWAGLHVVRGLASIFEASREVLRLDDIPKKTAPLEADKS